MLGGSHAELQPANGGCMFELRSIVTPVFFAFKILFLQLHCLEQPSRCALSDRVGLMWPCECSHYDQSLLIPRLLECLRERSV